jgi:hypothetical protein
MEPGLPLIGPDPVEFDVSHGQHHHRRAAFHFFSIAKMIGILSLPGSSCQQQHDDETQFE